MSNKIELSGIFSGGYGVIPKKLMQDQSLDVYQKAIMAYFMSYTGAGSIECWPSIKTIAFDLKISETKVKSSLRILEESGFISKMKLFPNDPMKNQNKYKITILENEGDIKNYGEPQDKLSTVAGEPSEVRHEDFINNNKYNNNKYNKNKRVRVKEKLVKPEGYDNLSFTKDQTIRLSERFDNPTLNAIFDKLSAYKEASGKKYKSDYGAINSWVADAVIEKQRKTAVR